MRTAGSFCSNKTPVLDLDDLESFEVRLRAVGESNGVRAGYSLFAAGKEGVAALEFYRHAGFEGGRFAIRVEGTGFHEQAVAVERAFQRVLPALESNVFGGS